MSKEEKSKKSYTANIRGHFNGQFLQGDGNVQIQTIGSSSLKVTEQDLCALKQVLADFKAQVEAEAPLEKKEEALKRVEELGEAIKAKEPDLDAMGGVKSWFKRNIPKLAGAVVGVIVNPIVGKVVEAAGEGVATAIKHRFGSDKKE